MNKRIVIVGATSGIGKCIAELYAKENVKIAIVGRRENLLQELAASAPNKYIVKICDITDQNSTQKTLDNTFNELGGIDLMIISSGTGDLNPKLDFAIEEQTLKTNVLGWTHIVDWAINLFEKQGFGHLASISSVGGLRGSGTAPAYNATKAFQINYLEGMRQKTNKLNKKIFITDIRPGFVDTAMAKGDGLFWVAPIQKAGLQIVKAIKKRKAIVYVTRRWRLIAFVLKHIPTFIYSKIEG